TVFTASAARKLKDHATPHRRDLAGKLHAIDWYADEKQVRASGSLKSSVRDLSAWMRLNLSGGGFGGKQLIFSTALKASQPAHIVVPRAFLPFKVTETTQRSYGPGWAIYDYRSHGVLEHTGSNDGFRARVILVPRKKLGIALLTNCEEAGMLQAIGNI